MLSLLATALLAQPMPCPKGWDSLSVPACVLRGSAPGVVIYLHGMMAPSERAFARELGFVTPAATRASMTVIAVRGEPGLCDWSKDYKDWWCWPSTRTRTKEADDALARIKAAIEEAERLRGQAFPPPLVAGYSNGGYFTSVLLERSVPVTGYAVLHGGLVSGVSIGERPKPILLVAAEGDTIQRPAMESFRSALELRHWTPAFVMRKKEHPLELEDFEQLFGFARRLSWPR